MSRDFLPELSGCDPGGLLQNRETGKSRKWLGRVLGRVLRKFGVLAGVLARVLLLVPFQGKPPVAAPSPALPPAPRISAAPSPAASPAIFWISLFLYSVAGRPGRNSRVFAKPMVCMRVAFHKTDGNHGNDESDSYKQGVECWIRGNHGNHGNDENHA